MSEVCSPEDKKLVPDFYFFAYWGVDGTPVLEIETGGLPGDPNASPKCRIYLNDDAIYKNPPYSEVEDESA